ncbi:MAG: multinuclear nonheme iron-dependent oxidase [Nitrospirales bacterium]
MGTSLSIGAFYNPHLATDILAHPDLFDHLAMADSPDPRDPSWPTVRERFTLLLHDYLGQLSEPLAPAALARAKRLLAEYCSPWAAEHVQRIRPTRDFNGLAGSIQLDYVFPPLYTEDLLEDYIRHARRLQEALGVPLALEPIPAYLTVDVPQLSEADFLHRLCEGSGCVLILDLAHLWLSARLSGEDPRERLQAMPLDRVIELHVAGCSLDRDLEELWIAPVLPEDDILDLAELAAAQAPALRAVTFDAFAPTLRAETLLAGIRMLRERFANRLEARA